MADVITRFKVESSEYEKKINKAKGSLSDFEKGANKLSNALGVNISALTKFGTALGALSAAFKVAKDAFLASEANIDEWGRTMRSANSAYEGFLTAINTGDISGYLSRIDQIVSAARKAYDEMDRLGTQKAIDNPRLKAQMAENERMRTMLRTGRYIAPTDGQNASMAEGTKLSKEQLANISSHLQAGVQTVNKIIRGEIVQTTKTIDSLYEEQASRLGMSLSEFRKGTSSMEEFDKRMEGYGKYMQWQTGYNAESARANSGHAISNPQYLGKSNPYAAYKAWGVFKDDGKLFEEINNKINERASLQSQYYSGTAQAYRSINTVENKILGGGGNPDKVEKEVDLSFKIDPQSEFSKKDIEKILAGKLMYGESLAKEWGLTANADNASSLVYMISGNTDPGDVVDPFKAKLRANADNYDYSGIEEAGNNAREAWLGAANAIGTVGSALAGIENPAAKVFGIIAEAIANVALSMAQALTKKESQMGGVWGWIAAAAAGTATMISTISAIKSATSYHAEGGIVGTSALARGTDTVPAMLTPGEIVLNRAQQGVLANRLQNSAFGQMQLSATIKGEDIRLALNNGSRRKGKGEYVTSK